MMQKMVVVVSLLLLLYPGLFTEEGSLAMVPGSAEPAGSAGYALLNKLMSGFSDMAQSGTGGYKRVDDMMQGCMADLKKAKEQKQVDAYFYGRYKRLLEVIKLTIIDDAFDREGILDSLVVREVRAFIDEVSGGGKDLPEGKEGRGIGAIAAAIADEIVNLHIYLDGQKNRKALIEKLSGMIQATEK